MGSESRKRRAFGGLAGAMGVRFEVRVNGRAVCVAALERPGLRFAESIDQLRDFPERCPRMTCSTNSSPNRPVNGPERNNKR